MQALALQRGLGTCAKLCSVVSAMRCALHLLMFCFNYLCNTTIPKRRETTLPFPAWEARNHWSKIPTAILERSYSQEHWTHLRPTISWNPSLSGTGLPNSFWRALKFLGGIVPVLFAPSHPAPLPQSLSSTQKPHFPRPHPISTGTLSPSVPPRVGIMCGLPRMPVSRRHTRRGERCSSLFVDAEIACDALRSMLTETGASDRTFVAIRTILVLVMA
jgi:hypothetical protein